MEIGKTSARFLSTLRAFNCNQNPKQTKFTLKLIHAVAFKGESLMTFMNYYHFKQSRNIIMIINANKYELPTSYIRLFQVYNFSLTDKTVLPDES